MRWLLLLFVSMAFGALSQESPKSVSVPAEQNLDKISKKNEINAQDVKVSGPATPCAAENTALRVNSAISAGLTEGGEDVSESWIVFGRRLKVTDSLLVLFTALLFAATYFLYLATRNLVKGSEETARRQLRAYVTASQIFETLTIDHSGNPTGWSFNVEWQNTGSTPTKDLDTWAQARLFCPGIPEQFNCPPPDLPREFTGVIGPHLKMQSGPVFVSMNDIEIAKAGGGEICFWARIEYNDVFQGTFRHHTAISVVLVLSRPYELRKANGSPFDFKPYVRGNSND